MNKTTNVQEVSIGYKFILKQLIDKRDLLEQGLLKNKDNHNKLVDFNYFNKVIKEYLKELNVDIQCKDEIEIEIFLLENLDSENYDVINNLIENYEFYLRVS